MKTHLASPEYRPDDTHTAKSHCVGVREAPSIDRGIRNDSSRDTRHDQPRGQLSLGRAPTEPMSDTTIPVSSELRDRLRKKKGFERTYDEFFEEELLEDDETAPAERDASPEVRSQ